MIYNLRIYLKGFSPICLHIPPTDVVVFSMDKALTKTAIFLVCILVWLMITLPNSPNTRSNHRRAAAAVMSGSEDSNNGDGERYAEDNNTHDYIDESDVNPEHERVEYDDSSDSNEYYYNTSGVVRYRTDSKIPYVTEQDIAATQSASSKDTSSKDTSSDNTSSDNTSSDNTSSDNTSSDNASSENTSSENTSSENTSSENASSEEIPEPTTSAENNRTANSLGDTYDIDIIIARTSTDYLLPEHSSYVKDEEQIKSCLRAVSYFLIYLPREILDDIGIETIVIVRSSSSTSISATNSSVLYISAYGYEKSQDIRDSVYSIIAAQFQEKLKEDNVELNFSKYNPSGFTYGITDTKYIYDKDKPHSILYGCFISEESQASESSDAAETLLFLLKNRYVIEEIPESAKIYPKLSDIKALAEQYFPTTKVIFSSV